MYTKVTTGIREQAERIVAGSAHARIDAARLADLALRLASAPAPSWDSELHFMDGGERTAAYFLALDAANFCFWPSDFFVTYKGKTYGRKDGYCALAVAFRRAFEEGASLWDAKMLAGLNEEDLRHVLRGEGGVPLFAERLANLRDLGKTLLDRYAGSAINLLEKCGYEAPRIAEELAGNFSAFRDRRAWRGQAFTPNKRAQIFVSDLAGALAGQSFGDISGLDRLTCFADYKLPQLFRHEGVFVYAPALDERINALEEIPENAEEEVEIRAATIVAVEMLKEELRRLGRVMTSREIDALLWETSVIPGAMSVPHHRTRTTAY